jgi:hypothetical protein
LDEQSQKWQAKHPQTQIAEPQPEPAGETETVAKSESIDQLTSELAESDPDKFKAILFSNLKNQTKHTHQAWEIALQKGIIAPQNVTIDASSMGSESQLEGGITLGTMPFDAATRAVFYEDIASRYSKQIVHTFTHELNHKLLSKLFINKSNEFDDVFRVIRHIREQTPDQGLSLLASHEGYKEHGPHDKAKEDLTELLSMYMMDPDYLKRFLTSLSSQDNEHERSQQGLTTLSENVASTIFERIDKAVRTGLEIST